MKQVTAFLKNLRLRQILTVFLVGVILVVTTACNTGDTQGARPMNPPVQAGGANNPYKGGGDNYSKHNSSTEAPVKNDRADLQLISGQLVALSNESKLIYPGTETGNSVPIVTPEKANKPQPGGLIQREPDVGDRIEDRLDAVKEAFQDAGSFLTNEAGEAGDRADVKVKRLDSAGK